MKYKITDTVKEDMRTRKCIQTIWLCLASQQNNHIATEGEQVTLHLRTGVVTSKNM